MTPGAVSSRVVADRLRIVDEMVAAMRQLPLQDERAFRADDRNVWTVYVLAGYRNRMVHFYHEVTASELLQIAGHELSDVEAVREGNARWVALNPHRMDASL